MSRSAELWFCTRQLKAARAAFADERTDFRRAAMHAEIEYWSWRVECARSSTVVELDNNCARYSTALVVGTA